MKSQKFYLDSATLSITETTNTHTHTQTLWLEAVSPWG